MLTAINNSIVIIKRQVKNSKAFVLPGWIFSLKFVGTDFISSII